MITYMYNFSKKIVKRATNIGLSLFVPHADETLFLQTDFVNGVIDYTTLMVLNSDTVYDKYNRLLTSKKFELANESIRKVRIRYNKPESGIFIKINVYADKPYSNGEKSMSQTINNVLTDVWYVVHPASRGTHFDISTNADGLEYFELEITGD